MGILHINGAGCGGMTARPSYRRGCDLYLKRKISLVEALCGFSMQANDPRLNAPRRAPC